MAALKAIREIAEHVRPRRGCQEGICGKCESKVNGRDTRLCITPIGTLMGAVVAHAGAAQEHLGLTIRARRRAARLYCEDIRIDLGWTGLWVVVIFRVRGGSRYCTGTIPVSCDQALG